MPRLVSLDAFRSVSILLVVLLNALENSNACGFECNWTQPLFYFEYMSGAFFMISGVVNALSMCGQFTKNQGRTLPILRDQTIRAAVLVIIGLSTQALAGLMKPLFNQGFPFKTEGLHRLLESGVWQAYRQQFAQAASDPRALVFHGACSLLSAVTLLGVLNHFQGSSRRQWGAPILLVLAAAVLAAHLPLSLAADTYMCCSEDNECKDTEVAILGQG